MIMRLAATWLTRVTIAVLALVTVAAGGAGDESEVPGSGGPRTGGHQGVAGVPLGCRRVLVASVVSATRPMNR